MANEKGQKADNTNEFFKQMKSQTDKVIGNVASNPTVFGGGSLPGGVNGIARLVKIEARRYEKGTNMKTADGKSAVGQFYFALTGVVVAPASHEGVPITGLQTRLMYNMFATKNSKGEVTSYEDNLDKLMNEFRKLGYEEEVKECTDTERLEELVMQINKDKPFFRFSTTDAKPRIDPRTKKETPGKIFHNWNGSQGLEDFQVDEHDGEVADETKEVEDVEEAPTKKQQSAVKNKNEPMDEFGDLDSLAKKADAGNKKARQELTSLAEKAGIEKEEIEGAESWADVVEMITNGAGQEETEEDEEQEEEVSDDADTEEVNVGDMVKWKSGKKTLNGKVVKINGDEVSVKSLVDGKVSKLDKSEVITD